MRERWTYRTGGGRVVSASGSETSVSSSTPARAIIYDAYTSIKNKNYYDLLTFAVREGLFVFVFTVAIPLGKLLVSL